MYLFNSIQWVTYSTWRTETSPPLPSISIVKGVSIIKSNVLFHVIAAVCLLYARYAAFPLGPKKRWTHSPAVLLRPQTLCGHLQLQLTKDWAFPSALLTGEYQRPQKHTDQQRQVIKLSLTRLFFFLYLTPLSSFPFATPSLTYSLYERFIKDKFTFLWCYC